MSKQDLKFVIDHFINYQQPEWKIEDDVRTACVAAILRWRPYTTDHIHPTTSIPSSIQDFLSQPWFNDCHGEADILYMRRALNPKDPWSGHIAFPGGKNEAIDRTPFDTVVRECKEETGLDLASPAFILLGTLDPIVLTSLKTRNPTMRLIPHIFLQVTPVTPQITIRPSEVSEITWTPIKYLLSDPIVVYNPMEHAETVTKLPLPGSTRVAGVPIQFPSKDVVYLWGMTLRMTQKILGMEMSEHTIMSTQEINDIENKKKITAKL